jgi:hypothetical protein
MVTVAKVRTPVPATKVMVAVPRLQVEVDVLETTAAVADAVPVVVAQLGTHKRIT